MSDNVFNDQVDLFCNELWKEMQQKFPLERPLKDKEKRNQLIELGNEIKKKIGTREALNLTHKYNELSNQLGTNDNPLTSDNVYIDGANENLIHLVDTIKETNNNNAPTDIYEWTANICAEMENSKASQDFKNFIIEFAGKENVEKMFPRPEPIVEIDPKKKEKIENWMKAVGLEGKADEMIQAYGDKAYALVQNAMANPKNMAEITDGTYRNSKNTLLYLLENKETMKEKVGDVDVLTIAGEKKRALDHFNDSFMDELSKRGTAIPKEGYASLLAALKTTPNTYADLLMAMDRVANERGFDMEKVKETKDLLTDFYENKYQDVMKNNTSVKKLEKGIIMPEINEMVGLNIEVPEVVLPEKIDAIPMYNLSELDMQKVKYTAAMLDELKLDGIRDKKIDKEIMRAFEKAMENDASNIKTWSGNFRFHLIDELNLEGRAYGSSKDEYSKLILPLVEGSDKIVEKLDSLPNDDPRYADLVAIVNKFNTKNDMKSQKGEIVQNADNQEKVEKVETKVSFREKFKAGRNRVLSYIGLKKKKENENASSDMEKSAEQVRDSENWVEVTASQAIEAPTTDRSYTR